MGKGRERPVRVPGVEYGDPFKGDELFKNFRATAQIRDFPREIIQRGIRVRDYPLPLPKMVVSRVIQFTEVGDLGKPTGRVLYLGFHDIAPYTTFHVDQLPFVYVAPEAWGGITFPEGPLAETLADPKNVIMYIDYDDLVRERRGDPQYRGQKNLHPRRFNDPRG